MAFRSTQLGRFGKFTESWNVAVDPDQRAAHIAARNGTVTATTTTFASLLSSKGLWDPADPAWRAWVTRLRGLLPVSPLLPVRCTRPHPRYPLDCWHELLPPVDHGNLRWFERLLRGRKIADNISADAPPLFSRDSSAWNFVITEPGEILLSREEYDAVKHPCIAGGGSVWSAGRVGVHSGLIRVVDLQSGHYVRGALLPRTAAAVALQTLTEDVFKQYAASFGISCLDPGFTCVW